MTPPPLPRGAPHLQLPWGPLEDPDVPCAPLGARVPRAKALSVRDALQQHPTPTGVPLVRRQRSEVGGGGGAHSINLPRARAKARPASSVPTGHLCQCPLRFPVSKLVRGSCPPATPPTACTKFHMIFTQRGECDLPPLSTPSVTAPSSTTPLPWGSPPRPCAKAFLASPSPPPHNPRPRTRQGRVGGAHRLRPLYMTLRAAPG